MKPSEFRKCYIASSNLYGVISSKDLFIVLKICFPKLTKQELYNDLRQRMNKDTRGYEICRLDKNDFIIKSPLLFFDEAQEIFNMQYGKKVFVPKTFEEFMELGSSSFNLSHPEYIDELISFLKKRIEENKLFLYISSFKYYASRETNNFFDNISKLTERYKVGLKDKNDLNKYLKLIQKISNCTRLYVNKGHTPNELVIENGPVDINNISISLGANIQKAILSGEMDPYSYLKGLDHLPEKAKESLQKEIFDLIKLKNKLN